MEKYSWQAGRLPYIKCANRDVCTTMAIWKLAQRYWVGVKPTPTIFNARSSSERSHATLWMTRFSWTRTTTLPNVQARMHAQR